MPWWGWLIVIYVIMVAATFQLLAHYRRKVDRLVAQGPKCRRCGGELDRAAAAWHVYSGGRLTCTECARAQARSSRGRTLSVIVLIGAFEVVKVIDVVTKIRAHKPLGFDDYVELAGGLVALLVTLYHLKSIGDRGPVHKELEAEIRRGLADGMATKKD